MRRPHPGSRGFASIEAMLALVVLALLTLPLIDLLVSATRTTAGGNQRAILELRARRHQTEVATTTYDTALTVAGRPFPLELGNPDDEDGHGKYLRGLDERTVLTELEPGLAEADTRIAWHDVATGRVHTVHVKRLIVDPTHSLRARYALSEVQ